MSLLSTDYRQDDNETARYLASYLKENEDIFFVNEWGIDEQALYGVIRDFFNNQK